MLSVESSGDSVVEVLVIGHEDDAIRGFEDALSELDRPFSLRRVADLQVLRDRLSLDRQFVVVANDRDECCSIKDVIACCSAASNEAPLIVVSEQPASNYDVAQGRALVKAGVSGYVYMDRLYRLFWSVQRELVRLDKTRAIRRIEARLSAILDIAPDAVIAADSCRRIIVFNRSAESIFGFRADEVLGRPLEMLMPARFAKAHGAKVAAFSAGSASAREMGERGEITAVRKNGAEFPAEASISVLHEDEGPVYVAILRDVTERKLAADKMAFLATHDSLTGLANRALLNDRLEHALRGLERGSRPVALMFIDLDGFKAVNDTLGHAAGDDLLRAIAGRLVCASRKSDTVARLGGDEFAVLFEGIDGPDAVAVIARKILRAVSEPVPVTGGRPTISASIGITGAAIAGKSAKDLMIEADLAMYEAKAAGKDRFAFHVDASREPAAASLAARRAAGGRRMERSRAHG